MRFLADACMKKLPANASCFFDKYELAVNTVGINVWLSNDHHNRFISSQKPAISKKNCSNQEKTSTCGTTAPRYFKNVRMVRTRQHPWFRSERKILPTRICCCSNTNCDRRSQCEDNNVVFTHVQPHYNRVRQVEPCR